MLASFLVEQNGVITETIVSVSPEDRAAGSNKNEDNVSPSVRSTVVKRTRLHRQRVTSKRGAMTMEDKMWYLRAITK